MRVFNMEFYIYDKNDDRVGVLDNYSSIQWISNYDTTGEFWIVAKETDLNLMNLITGNRILKTDDNTIGFIKYSYSHDGIMDIRGYLDNLDDRINFDTAHIRDVSRDISALVENNTRGLDIRVIDHIGPDVLIEKTETTYKPLRDTISSTCIQTGTGYRFVKKGDHFNCLELYKRDRNYNVIFSEEYNNIVEQSYSKDTSNYKNVAIVAGEGEGSERKIVMVDQANDQERYELFVDARDITRKYTDENKVEHTYLEKEYEEILKQRGVDKLKEKKAVEDYRVNIDATNDTFVYKKDFFLGDIVKVKSLKYGFCKWFRIKSVKEIYEKSYRIVLTLDIEGS